MSDEFGILTDKEQAFVDAYAEKIRKEERERIIALLEAVDDELGIFAVGWTMQEIAELVKGENE